MPRRKPKAIEPDLQGVLPEFNTAPAIVDQNAQNKRIGEDGHSETTRAAVGVSGSGISFLLIENEMVYLNDIWKQAGSPKNREPRDWAKLPTARDFIVGLGQILNGGKSPIWKSRRGKHLGGTWAHWKVAAEYAGYLKPAFRNEILDKFKDWVEEASDPSLKADRAIEAMEEQHGSIWTKARIQGKVVRVGYTSKLGRHGVIAPGFAEITDAANTRLLGAPAKVLHKAWGLEGKSVQTRDHLSSFSLALLGLGEASISRKLDESPSIRGNEACLDLAVTITDGLKEAMEKMGFDLDASKQLPSPSSGGMDGVA